VPYPLRRQPPLTQRQREVVKLMRLAQDLGETVRPLHVGRLMHAVRPFHVTPGDYGPCCRYASSDGCDALRRLERRGLVAHVSRGAWELVRHQESWL
jgi:hypothetical protein